MRNRGDIDEHRPLMEAAIARQTDLAVELLTQHMTHTTDILLDNWEDISKT
jgi:DNA-binding GntR family transcriptional regulator